MATNTKRRRLLGLFSGVLGGTMLLYVIYPFLQYDLFSRQAYPELLSPLGNVQSSETEKNNADFTKASNWFGDGKKSEDFTASKVSYYTLSIPALDIEDAITSVGGEDLEKHLIQYPGTALPGKSGNAVIFGHSILPIFYNPRNYLAIFSTLPTIKVGEEIDINFDGVKYKYLVEEKFEVKPTDIQILEQNQSGSYLTLVTCTPPGDPRRPKRLIVRAKLVESI